MSITMLPGVHETVQRPEQPFDVGDKPGRRLVGDVDRVLRALQRGPLGGDLDPLCLAADSVVAD